MERSEGCLYLAQSVGL